MVVVGQDGYVLESAPDLLRIKAHILHRMTDSRRLESPAAEAALIQFLEQVASGIGLGIVEGCRFEVGSLLENGFDPMLRQWKHRGYILQMTDDSFKKARSS